MENRDDEAIYLVLEGKVSQPQLDSSERDQLDLVLGQGNFGQQILVSFEKTNMIDSSGIGWLLSMNKRIKNAGGTLVLHSIPQDIQNVMGLMNMQKVLHLATDLRDAKARGRAISTEDGANHVN